MPRIRPWAASLVIFAVLGSSGCARIFYGRYQTIPVTSRPPGARVTLDGEAVGTTPVSLRLTRKTNHVVRVEMDGREPLEIVMNSSAKDVPQFILANTFVGAVPTYLLTLAGGFVAVNGREEAMTGIWPVALSMIWAAELVGLNLWDSHDGRFRKFDPAYLSVTLQEASKAARSVPIALDRDRTEALRWISVRAGEGNSGPE